MVALRRQKKIKIRVLWLFILTCGVLLYGVWLFALLLRTPSDQTGVYFGDQVLVKQVPPRSPLKVDDVILRLDQLDVNERLLKPGYWSEVLLRHRNLQGVTYTVQRDGQILQLFVPWSKPSVGAILWRGGALWLISSIMLIVAIIMLMNKGERLEARLLAFLFVMVALIQINNMFPTSGGNVALIWSWLFIPIDMFAVWFGVSVFLHAMLAFPEIKAPLKRYPWLPGVIHLAMPCASLVIALISGRETVIGFRAMIFMVTNSLMMVYMLLGLAALTHTYRNPPHPGVRNQIRWILWGLAVAIFPWICFYALPSMVQGTPWLPLNIVNITGVMVPIAFMISIFRYRLLDIDFIVNRTLVYLTSFVLLILLYLLVVSASSNLIMRVTGAPNDYLAGVMAMLIVSLIFNPLRLYVQQVIDRTFYREQLDVHRMLHEVNTTLSTTILFRDVVDLLTRQISHRLGLSHASIVLASPELTIYTVQGTGAFEGTVPDVLMEWLEENNAPLLFYALPQLPPRVALVVQDLAEDDVEICLPLRQQNKLLGVYLFGSKNSGNLLNRQEVDTLLLLSHQAAAALRNAQLYRELQDYNRLLESRVKSRTAELQAERNRLDTIVQNIADGLVVTDLNGEIILANPSFSNIVNMSDLALLGGALGQVFPAEDLQQLVKLALMHPGEVFRANIPVQDQEEDIASRVYNASACALRAATPVVGSGNNDGIKGSIGALGVVTILRDVTHEWEVDRMKTNFISTVSHELRTPLTSVLGFAKIIGRAVNRDVVSRVEEDDKRGQRALKRIQENLDIIASEGDRLTRLINDVLDIAKMDAGKIEWHFTEVEIEAVIRSAVASTSALASEQGLPVHVNLDPDLPLVKADQDRLIQVVTNLLSNAIKFTDTGYITVRAFCAIVASDGTVQPPIVGLGVQQRYLRTGTWLAVSVRDTGIGIVEDDLSQVFEKFKQVTTYNDTITKHSKGTGLGLPICREIVTQHGGRIGVESELGQGSIFTFALPLDTEPLVQSTQPQSSLAPLEVQEVQS